MTRVIKSPVPPQRKKSIDLSSMEFKEQAMAKSKVIGSSDNTLMTQETLDTSESGNDNHNMMGSGKPSLVKFAKTAPVVHETLDLKDYSQDEKDGCWFTSEEKEKYTSKREKIIVRMELGKPEKNGKPFRGLECWTEKGSKALNEQITRTINAVMDEQDRQWASGVDDYTKLANVSKQCTTKSKEAAINVGMQDEEFAFAIRGTMFDDVNALTDDDSVVGMANLIAKKRRSRENRRNRKNKNGEDGLAAGRNIRRSGRRPDPDGEDAAQSKEVKAQKERAKEAMKMRALERIRSAKKEKAKASKKKRVVRIASLSSDDSSDGDASDEKSLGALPNRRAMARARAVKSSKQSYDEPWR